MLTTDPANSVKHESVSIAHVSDPKLRSMFFVNLMFKMDGFKFSDVSYVDVDKMRIIVEDESEDDDIAPTEVESEDKNTDDNLDERQPQMKPEAITIVGVVNGASLRGEQLLSSKEYKEMSDKGFFLSHCIWKATEEKDNGRQVEFQAEFANAIKGTNFKYSIRGTYERFKNGNFKKTKTIPTPAIASYYLQILEATAVESINEIEAVAENAKQEPGRAFIASVNHPSSTPDQGFDS